MNPINANRTFSLSAFKHTLGLSMLTFSIVQTNLALAAVTPATGNEVEARVSSILDNMNLSEKINFTRVNDGHMIPSLLKWGIKGTTAYDSSMGVHVNNATFGAQYPSQSALAATWSINRAKEFGLAIAYETKISGGQQMLSPGVNLYRQWRRPVPRRGTRASHRQRDPGSRHPGQRQALPGQRAGSQPSGGEHRR